ncbi:MAG TPA: VOC family protein [Saliniramus sp.]|nr:VOC family protein [Saliniramus sp.]
MLSPPRLAVDHLAIAAATREGGVAWVRDRLGVTVPAGGEHPRMGTHTAVAGTGDSNYLEILAIDPSAPAPAHPRWFGLDEPALHEELATRPRIATWVVRTPDIEASLAAARAAGLDLGSPIAMTRGDLSWTIACREDGKLPEGGVIPVLIQWPEGPHPSTRMSDCGLRLVEIVLRHPQPERLADWCEAIGVRHLATIDPQPSERPTVEVAYEGPQGIVRL